MTNPQKENGYTPIYNEVLEAIYNSPFNATQLKIIMIICRYTYGFSRKEHSISETFISKAANISKRYISSELNKLVEQRVVIITKPHTDITSRVLKLNKHYDEWLFKTMLPQVNNTSTGEQLISTTGEQYITTPVEQSFYQDKQNLKQNIKQDDTELYEQVWSLYPNKTGKSKAMKKIPNLVKKYGFEKMKLSIEGYIESVKAKRKTFAGLKYQDGSTFFNGTYEDFINKEIEKKAPILKVRVVESGYLE